MGIFFGRKATLHRNHGCHVFEADPQQNMAVATSKRLLVNQKLLWTRLQRTGAPWLPENMAFICLRVNMSVTPSNRLSLITSKHEVDGKSLACDNHTGLGLRLNTQGALLLQYLVGK